MSSYEAVYARQSVDKIDSISVESQVELCKREVTGRALKVYTDKGYSGKSTDRPAFQSLLSDIRLGKINRVIVYRLDRISRSVLDFANLIELFQKNGVAFVSTTERFDTGSPIGKAMLMIIMIFAQLERETIQQRVIDAYSSRSKRGFYMGGRVPFGFRLKEAYIDGVRTKMYEPIEEEADIIKRIFSLYCEPQTSFGDVVRNLSGQGIQNRNGKPFSRSRLRDVVINPIYVKADYRLYDFFKAQGTDIVNSPEDFIGINGAYLYSGDKERRKTVSLEGHTLVIAPHKGLIDSDIWIKCRLKCLNGQSVAKPVKAKATWLAGKIKCANCGYALTAKIYRCKTKSDNRYYICSNKYNGASCSLGSLNADTVDEIVFNEMQNKLAAFKTLLRQKPEESNFQVIKLKIRIAAIEKEIASLLDKVTAADEAAMQYINNRIAKLDTEKKELCAKIVRLDNNRKDNIGEISGYMEHWEELSVSDKIAVADCLIERITASKESIEIRWKI